MRAVLAMAEWQIAHERTMTERNGRDAPRRIAPITAPNVSLTQVECDHDEPQGSPLLTSSECPERAHDHASRGAPHRYNQSVFFVYMVRCGDGTLYTGYARDPEDRVRVHNAGKGAKYTRSRLPVVLVYVERCESVSAALKRERQLKPWSRAKKEALIAARS